MYEERYPKYKLGDHVKYKYIEKNEIEFICPCCNGTKKVFSNVTGKSYTCHNCNSEGYYFEIEYKEQTTDAFVTGIYFSTTGLPNYDLDSPQYVYEEIPHTHISQENILGLVNEK